MSSDSHSDDHGHSTSHGDDHSHDSHGHAVATDVIPETSLQDMLLKVLTICAAGLLYGMAFWWMGVPVAEVSHEAGSEHSEQSHGSEHSEEHH